MSNEKDNKKNQAAAPVVTETPKVEKKKWYEEGKGFGFEVKDVVYIGLGHPNGVADRFAEVLGPSEKPNHIKAKMQNPKTGELQRSEVVIDNAHLLLVTKNGAGNAVGAEHGDAFSMDAAGIYKTKAQVDKEALKNKAKSPAEATASDDMAAAQ